MRRKDREITDGKRIDDIITACTCCRLGFYDKGSVYIVPLNFGYENKNGTRIFYFHSAKQGRKIPLIEACPQVGFELDTDHRLQPGRTACDYSMGFQSVIGSGVVAPIHDRGEKQRALQALMYQNTRRHGWDFSDEMTDAVYVFRLTVTSLSCKEHR